MRACFGRLGFSKTAVKHIGAIRNLMISALATVSCNLCSAQFQSDTAFQWKGAGFTIFSVQVDSSLLSAITIEENINKVREDSLFARYFRKGEFFAITGAIVDASCKPMGLHIAGGVTKKPLNLGTGTGNFYDLKNGIIGFTKADVLICNSRDFRPDTALKWALQTGPVLVDSSRINAQLRKESQNRNIRVGAGIIKTGNRQTLIFVRSNVPVTFYHLASLFQESFQCQTAICLQSGIASIRIPGISPSDFKASNESCIYIRIRL